MKKANTHLKHFLNLSLKVCCLSVLFWCSHMTASAQCTITAQWVNYTPTSDTVHFYAYDTSTVAHHIWNWGDGTSTSGTISVNHVFPGPGTYHVCFYSYIPNTSCSDSLCENVVIPPTCHANFSYYQFGTSDSFNFYSASTSNDSILNYNWSFGDGTYGTGRYLHHTYSVPGTYVVCLTFGTVGGCQSAKCDTIHFAGVTTCGTGAFRDSVAGTTVYVYSTSTGTSSNTNYSWRIDGGALTAAGPNTGYTFYQLASGYHRICLYLYNGTALCDSVCQYAYVGSNCNINIQWSHYVLDGDTLRFYSYDTNTVAHHIWNWGDGTSTSGVTVTNHVFPGPGTYHVCYYVYIPGTTCSDSLCETVTVAAPPCTLNASWSYTVLGGDSVRFSFTPDSNTTHHHNWNFGDGTSSGSSSITGITHVYTQPGNYHVCQYVYVANGCIDSFCQNIVVTGGTTCNVTADWVSYGLGGDTVRFYGADTNSLAHHYWIWGDNSSYGTYDGDTAINHVYTAAGTYHVCLYVYIPGTTCSDSLCKNVTVSPPPCHLNAAWNYTVSGDTVRFIGEDTISSNHHDWNFGDGTYSANNSTAPSHVYAHPGTYHVCLYVYTNGCVDSFCQNITTQAACNANFIYYAYGTSDSANFYSTSTSNDSIFAYDWSWGDGTYGTGRYLHHVFPGPGTYVVCLTIGTMGGCQSTHCDTIYIAANTGCGTAAFKDSVAGTTVYVTSTSTGTNGNTYYSWHIDGGAGTTASQTATTHTFGQLTNGYHRICLYLYNGSSLCDSVCKYVYVGPVCNIRYGWTYTVSGDTVRFNAEDTVSAAHHFWNFGDGTSTTTSTTDPVHVYAQPGTYHVCFYVYLPNVPNCSDSFCQNVTVTAPCHVSASWSSYALHGDSVRFYGPDTNSTAHHIWVWGDGTYTSGVTITNHTFPLPGTYHVCYYVYIPGTNCIDSMCNNVTVGNGGAPSTCNITANWTSYSIGGDSIRFHAADTNTTAHHVWTFGDGTYAAAIIDPMHVYAQPGTYHVCLYVYIPNTNCVDSSCGTVTIAPPTTPPCTTTAYWRHYALGGDTVRFYASDTTSAAHHIWVWGDGTYTSGTTATNHVFPGAGTYHVCLYVYIPGTTCSDSLCENITVAGNTCNITAQWAAYSLGGDTVRFYSADTNTAAHHIWVWGDGTYTSGTTETTHVYPDTGTYHACYYVYIPGTNCMDSMCQDVEITANGHFILTAHFLYNHLGSDTVGFVAMDTNTNAAIYEIWSFGDGTFAFNTNNPSHVYAQSGTYTVCLYVFIPGTDISDTICQTINVTVLGIETVAGQNIRIITQPNPFSQSTMIRTEGLNGTFDFKLYDIVGKQLRYEKSISGSYTLQREGLTSGMYLFEILQDGKVIGTGKLVAE